MGAAHVRDPRAEQGKRRHLPTRERSRSCIFKWLEVISNVSNWFAVVWLALVIRVADVQFVDEFVA